MNCKQYQRSAADGATDRLTPGRRNEMAAHAAVCPNCVRRMQEEEALVAAWRGLAEEIVATPSPDIRPRLSARLNEARLHSPRFALHPRKVGYIIPVMTVGILMGLLVWRQESKEATRKVAISSPSPVTLPPTKRVAVNKISLTEMLTEVRWRSSDEREIRLEHPSYNEERRSLLLSNKGESH